MMTKVMKRRWIRALKSGEFKKGRRALVTSEGKRGKRYCCLGVLCEITPQAVPDEGGARY